MAKLFKDLPRGFGKPDDRSHRTPDARWPEPEDLCNDPALIFDLDYNLDGRIVLGEIDGQLIGLSDDRHLMTVAGSRAGKGVSAVVPNLLTYPGSVLAIDPKGELACLTAKHRAQNLGQRVYVLDPFERVSPEAFAHKASYNPMTILEDRLTGELTPYAIEDAGLIADALVVPSGGDSHWDDSARHFLEGLILHVATCTKHLGHRDLIRVYSLLMHGPTGTATGEEAISALDELKAEMLGNATALRSSADRDPDAIEVAVGAAIAAAVADFFDKPPNERGSVLSSLRKHVRFLGFKAIAGVLQQHDFDLTDFKNEPAGVTIYLCLPATRLATCSRWFRLFVNLALEAMERVPEKPPVPVLLVLDEFAVLGHMRQIENAAGQIAGFGVKLWPILQDLTQLKAIYNQRWETFLGNAGVLQFFGNSDATTLEYIEKRLGRTTMLNRREQELTREAIAGGQTGISWQPEQHPLLTADEAARIFARDDPLRRQLIITASERKPFILQRLRYYDHPRLRHLFNADCAL